MLSLIVSFVGCSTSIGRVKYNAIVVINVHNIYVAHNLHAVEPSSSTNNITTSMRPFSVMKSALGVNCNRFAGGVGERSIL